MTNLNKVYLKFQPTYDFFFDNLDQTNILSTELLKLIDFKEGKFFTFFVNDVDMSKIHNFKLGGIANGVRDHINSIVLNELNNNIGYSCIFDDVNNDYDECDNEDPFFQNCGLFYKKENYYYVDQKNKSIDLINDCLRASNAIWHSLCVFSEINLQKIKNKELTLHDIKNICLQVKLIMILAYDAEGYIFWEKN